MVKKVRLYPGGIKPGKRTNPKAQMKTAREPIIILDPEAEYPPEMARLTDTRKRFVIACVHFPGKTQADWARYAGLGSEAQGGREAWRLLNDETVTAAIASYTQHLFAGDAPLYRHKLREWAMSEIPTVSLKACEIGLRYTPVQQSPTRHIHEHTVELTTDELKDRLRQIYAENPDLRQIEDKSGLIPSGDIAENDDAIDAEFAEAA